MPIYRKKPSLVEARQVVEGNLESVGAWCDGAILGLLLPRSQRVIEIGDQEAGTGDWIVKEANGAFSVYTDEAFRLLHEVD